MKTQTENFHFECQNEFQKGRSGVYPLFSMELIIEKKRV